jgi:hypothetical protein
MKTIEITINSKGETRVETKGFVGAQCREASRFLELSFHFSFPTSAPLTCQEAFS